MKIKSKLLKTIKLTIRVLVIIPSIILFISCGNSSEKGDHAHENEKTISHDEHNHDDHHDHKGHDHEEQAHENGIIFTNQQFEALGMSVDTLQKRNMHSFIKTNGRLEVPPQSEASITAVIGANIQSINVIEGDRVKKGKILAHITHPDIIQIQTEYLTKSKKLDYFESEYNRKKSLYEDKVSSGKEYELAKSDFFSAQAELSGIAAQLKLIGIDIKNIVQNGIKEKIAIKSPISGYIRFVNIKLGQYVKPETELFQIVDVEHIHADLMVFEKDIYKVKEGQKVKFHTDISPNVEFTAEIYSVGKSFEKEPKAVHLHAEIENKTGMLIPGMYVRGRIITNDTISLAMPEEAIINENGRNYIFSAQSNHKAGEKEWNFEPVEIIVTGNKDNKWVEVILVKNKGIGKFLMNNAYYVIAEMKKAEAEHTH